MSGHVVSTKYEWALIRSGEAFQSLANTLLLFERPGTRVFGRAGKDGGQDARSADGKTVYQHKHHCAPSFSKVVSDAQGEVAKISGYRQASDKRYALWQNVEEWVLVTNVPVNPIDQARWDKEVVPEFQKMGLRAVLWSGELVEALLTKHPQVAKAYLAIL